MSPTFNSSGENPNYLVELSMNGLCPVIENSIHLSGFWYIKGTHKKENLCQYIIIEYSKKRVSFE